MQRLLHPPRSIAFMADGREVFPATMLSTANLYFRRSALSYRSVRGVGCFKPTASCRRSLVGRCSRQHQHRYRRQRRLCPCLGVAPHTTYKDFFVSLSIDNFRSAFLFARQPERVRKIRSDPHRSPTRRSGPHTAPLNCIRPVHRIALGVGLCVNRSPICKERGCLVRSMNAK